MPKAAMTPNFPPGRSQYDFNFSPWSEDGNICVCILFKYGGYFLNVAVYFIIHGLVSYNKTPLIGRYLRILLNNLIFQSANLRLGFSNFLRQFPDHFRIVRYLFFKGGYFGFSSVNI